MPPGLGEVITPVVDSLGGRKDVDSEKLVCSVSARPVTGCSGRCAFEHRIAAGVADPGVVDVSTTVLGHLPHMMIKC